MKTKLNIYCLFIFAVIIIDMAMTTDVIFSGMISANKTIEYNDRTDKAVNIYRVVSLIPNEITYRNAITITDSVTKKTYKAWPTQLNLPAEGKPDLTGSIISMVTGIAIIIFGIMTLVSFIRFVLNINHNRIFTKKNTKHLKRIGWCMILIGILTTLKYSNDAYASMQTFSLTGYSLDYSSAIYTGTLLFGLFSLVIAEAFAIGVKMKEEQELTI